MEHTPKVHRAENDKVQTANSQLVCLLFENEQSSKVAISELNKRGHNIKDFKVLSREDLSDQPCRVQGEVVDSDQEFMRKALAGIKVGALWGGIIASILIIISIFNNPADLSITLILLIAIGAVAGAIMGFLVAPLLPFKSHKMYIRKLLKENILIRFQLKSKDEKIYLKHMNWTICQLG
ncbi:MAG: hypothetical protein ACJA2C_002744 [Marinoscillum sp.]|jgi:hypothetical protein